MSTHHEKDGVELLATYAGSAEEARSEAAFLRLQAALEEPDELERVPPRSRSWGLAALTLAAAAALLLVLPSGKSREKGAPLPRATMEVAVGRIGASGPELRRRFVGSGVVEPGERALFRFHLEQPSRVALVIHGGAPAELVWRSNGVLPPGDHEVSSGNAALGLDLSAYERQVAVTLIASEAERTEQELLEVAAGSKPCVCAVVTAWIAQERL